jgi:hypothetical protein
MYARGVPPGVVATGLGVAAIAKTLARAKNAFLPESLGKWIIIYLFVTNSEFMHKESFACRINQPSAQ